MLQPPPPPPKREPNRNLRLGSSRGRRGGPGRQPRVRRAAAEPAQGGERSSRCPGPGHRFLLLLQLLGASLPPGSIHQPVQGMRACLSVLSKGFP